MRLYHGCMKLDAFRSWIPWSVKKSSSTSCNAWLRFVSAISARCALMVVPTNSRNSSRGGIL